MIIYFALLILPAALITGILLLHFGQKKGNKTKRTIGLILLILGILIALFLAAFALLILLYGNSVTPSQ